MATEFWCRHCSRNHDRIGLVRYCDDVARERRQDAEPNYENAIDDHDDDDPAGWEPDRGRDPIL